MAAPTTEQIAEWTEAGVLAWHNFLAPGEVEHLRTTYDEILSGRHEGTSKHRYDLGAGAARVLEGVENITQVCARGMAGAAGKLILGRRRPEYQAGELPALHEPESRCTHAQRFGARASPRCSYAL